MYLDEKAMGEPYREERSRTSLFALWACVSICVMIMLSVIAFGADHTGQIFVRDCLIAAVRLLAVIQLVAVVLKLLRTYRIR